MQMPWSAALRRADEAHVSALIDICERIERLESAPAPVVELDPIHATLKELADRLTVNERHVSSVGACADELEEQAKDFVIALSEGIERTDRAERRIKATVARARKELKARGYEDPGLDAEAYELRDVDADGGNKGGVLPLQSPVGPPAEHASSIRGVSREILQRVRG